MSVSTVQRAREGVAKAIAARDWIAADRGLDYLAGAWLRAAGAADPSELEKVANDVHKMRIGMMTVHNIPQKIGPEQIAWMLAGMSSVLRQARRPERLTAHNTQGRILEALFLANAPLSTKALAQRIGRADATVGRELPKMRKAGLVACHPAGSEILNWITDAGRMRHHAIDQEEQTGIRSYPTTLTKLYPTPKPTMKLASVAADLGRPESQPNDVCTIATADIR